MAKKLTYHFYLKDKWSTKPTPINLAINSAGFRKKYGIGESISPEWWDDVEERAIEDNRQKKTEKALSKRVNRNLKRIRAELDPLFEEYNGIGKLTPNHTEGEDLLLALFDRVSAIVSGLIQEENEEEKASRITPTLFFTDFIERWSRTPNNRTGVVPKKETIWNYKNTLRRYKDFIEDNSLKDTFKIFDEDFQSKFDDYLLNEQELAMNTIVGTHSQLKTMLKRAYEKGLLRDPAFLHWTSKTINFTHIYLNDLEINSLYELVLTPEMRKENKIGKESHIEESKDLFIISARTGLRFSDLRHIGSATWDMSEGKETLTILIQKTNDRLSIPLHKQVIEIYEKYKGVLPLPVDKSKYNEHVRLCAKLAGITENIATFEWEKGRPVMKDHKKYELISSHTGRRSFATNLYLVCKSPHYVMNLTGHQTEENFKRYICVDQKEMAEVVRKYINLDYNGEGDEDFERFVRALKQDTHTIDQQQEEIAQLQKEVQSTKQMDAISEMQRQDAETEVEEQKEAWGMGLSLGDYEDLKRQGDAIAAATDQQPDD